MIAAHMRLIALDRLARPRFNTSPRGRIDRLAASHSFFTIVEPSLRRLTPSGVARK